MLHVYQLIYSGLNYVVAKMFWVIVSFVGLRSCEWIVRSTH